MTQSQSKKFTLPSGAVLAVTIAPFQDAFGLTKAVLRSVKGLSLSPADMTKDFKSMQEAAVLIPAFLDKIISFATSEEVEHWIFKCAVRALYIPAGSPPEFPGLKVSQELFDNPEHMMTAREDYPQILLRLVEVNCQPFLVKALSGLMKP